MEPVNQWMNDTKRTHIQLSALERTYVLLVFLLSFFWSVVFVIPSYGPDETMRILVPRYIVEHHVIPCGWETALRSDVWGFSYAFQMKLPYLIAAVFVQWMSLFASFLKATPAFADSGMLIAARFVSVLSMTGVAYFAIRIARKITSSPSRWIFILLTSLTPQSVFIGSYLNLDAFSLFVVLMIMDAWLVGMATKWNKTTCAWLGALLGLCLLGYEFAYSYMLASALVFLLWHIEHRKELTFREFWGKVGIVILFFFLVCGWYLIRNGILYKGDILACSIQKEYGEQFAMDGFKPSMRSTHKSRGVALLEMLRKSNWIGATAESSFCTLGYMSVQIPHFIYNIHFSFLLVGIAFFALFWRNRYKDKLPDKLLASLAAAALVTLVLAVYYSWSSDYQAQGRYILYSLVPAYMGVAFGWRTIAVKLGNLLRLDAHRLQCSIAGMVFAGLLASNILSFIVCMKFFFPAWGT